jgi:hypothetical protein
MKIPPTIKHEYKGVWVYNAEKSMFPCAVFDSKRKAIEWITKNKVSGCLTLYPINKSIYEWAIEEQYFVPKKPEHFEKKYIGSFTSAHLEHFHFEFDEHGKVEIC